MTDAITSQFREHEANFAPGDERLRQGDVLEFLGDEGFPAGWHDVLGIVVTANCDLARGKHWGTITYVPAVPVDTYVQHFTLPKVLAVEDAKAEQAVRRALARVGPLAADRAVEMVRLGHPVDRITTLLPDDAGKGARAALEQSLAVLQACHATMEAIADCDDAAFLTAVDDYCRRMDELRPAKEGRAAKLRGTISDSLEKLPGDAMFLSEPGPGRAGGYVALLRLVRSVEDGAVSRAAVEEMRAPGRHRARRVARLGVLYCHRVVQQMATVFTDIGLPREYELARTAHIGTYVEKLGHWK